MASWQQRAGRGDDGPEGYALGDVTRIGVQTIKDIFKGAPRKPCHPARALLSCPDTRAHAHARARAHTQSEIPALS